MGITTGGGVLAFLIREKERWTEEERRREEEGCLHCNYSERKGERELEKHKITGNNGEEEGEGGR